MAVNHCRTMGVVVFKLMRCTFLTSRNVLIISNVACFIVINKNNTLFYVSIDKNKIDCISKYSWHMSLKRDSYYVVGSRNGEHCYLHNLIIGKKSGFVVDHINKNPLDNRLDNLRFISNRQNLFRSRIFKNNQSGYPGVYLRKETNKWCAQITVMRKTLALGSFDNKFDAIKKRRQAEIYFFGENKIDNYKGSAD